MLKHLKNYFSIYNTLYKDIPPTEEEFYKSATELRESNKKIMPVTDTEV